MIENPMTFSNGYGIADSRGDDPVFDLDANGNEILYGDKYLNLDGQLVLKDLDATVEFMKEYLGASEHVAEA